MRSVDKKVNRKTVEATLASDPEIAADISVKNDPELQNLVNTSLSDNNNINNNNDILTTEEREIRDSKVNDIAENIRQRNTFEKGTPEYKAVDRVIKKQRSELKETVKEQDFKYKKITPEQRGIIAETQSQIDSNNKAIQTIQDKGGSEALITQLQEENQELQSEQDSIRAQVEQEAQVRAAKNEQARATREAEAEALAQEEITPEQEQEQAEAEAIAAQQAEVQEQINAEVDEEATDNSQKMDKLTDSMLELGIDIEPVSGTVPQEKGAEYTPLGKEGEAYVAGDFEKNINFDPDIPLEKVDAKKAKKEIEETAKQLGAKADVEIVRVGEGWGVQGKLTSGKRPESLAVKYATQQEEGVQPTAEEYAPDQSAFLAPEEAEVKSTERAQAIAEEAGFTGTVTDTPEGIQFEGVTEGSATQDKRPLHKTVNSLKKRGYPEAYADVTTGTVVKGPYKPETATDEFSLKG